MPHDWRANLFMSFEIRDTYNYICVYKYAPEILKWPRKNTWHTVCEHTQNVCACELLSLSNEPISEELLPG